MTTRPVGREERSRLSTRDRTFWPRPTAAPFPIPVVGGVAGRAAPMAIPTSSHAPLGPRAPYVVAPPPPRYRDVTPGRHHPLTPHTPLGNGAKILVDSPPRVPLDFGGPQLGFPLTPELRLPSPSFPGGTRPPPPTARLTAPQLRPKPGGPATSVLVLVRRSGAVQAARETEPALQHLLRRGKSHGLRARL